MVKIVLAIELHFYWYSKRTPDTIKKPEGNMSRRLFDDRKLDEKYEKYIRESKWNRTRSFDNFIGSGVSTILYYSDHRFITHHTYFATVSIPSCNDEAERERLEVPLQEVFNGPSYVLPSEIAAFRLADLGEQDILSQMNEILCTRRSCTNEMLKLLRFCRRTFKDFGQAYACLRPRWHMGSFDALENIKMRRKEDEDLRLKSIEHDIVVKPRCPPRRVWDIWSNRVVPFWVVCVDRIRESTADFPLERREWLAISHSWVNEEHRHDVDTLINGNEWPVPIPKDTTLERIRIELLNLSERYFIHFVWLDVLCLRQEGEPSKEDLRKAEWKLDVPTIGPIYEHAQRTVYYFSGLGRPFKAPTDKHGRRHWMNRAWTLQETQPCIIVAGQSSSSPKIPYAINHLDFERNRWQTSMDRCDDNMKALMTPFVENHRDSVWAALRLMQNRTGTSELDKIAGLVYRLNGFEPPIPAYIVGENIEDAWNRLIKATRPKYRAELFKTFCLFPEPETGHHNVYPSWHQLQIMDMNVLQSNMTVHYVIWVDMIANGDTCDMIWCCALEHCWVEGLSNVSIGNHSNYSSRLGKVRIEDKDGKERTFSIEANHKIPVTDGYYTLLGYAERSISFELYWAVARKTDDFIEKVSVIEFKGRENYYAITSIAKCVGQTTLRLR